MVDIRFLPFLDDPFEAIYSMGTIEHFDETEEAIYEIYLVLKPRGKAIVGLLNRHDLIFRPLQVFILKSLGLYPFGYEKSFSRSKSADWLESLALSSKLRGHNFLCLEFSGGLTFFAINMLLFFYP